MEKVKKTFALRNQHGIFPINRTCILKPANDKCKISEKGTNWHKFVRCNVLLE